MIDEGFVFRRLDGSGPDMLGCRPVEDGEILTVTWPDGTITEERAIVKDGVARIQAALHGLRLNVHLHRGPRVHRAAIAPECEDDRPYPHVHHVPLVVVDEVIL